MLEYSIIIRTTGKAGEKYRKLLQSISKLDPLPKEVIVVLPNGYDLPEDKLGWESFYFCPKGMVKQRLFGIEKCHTKYALITDDDIAFEADFVQKLHEPIEKGLCGITAGPLLCFFPQPGIQTLYWALGAAAMPSIKHKNRYITVVRSTGYTYNRHLLDEELYETQSAAWTCFYADIDKLRSIHFEDELWLDRFGYSAHDDTAMFYKAWIHGIKTIIVPKAKYEHLDGKTSTRGKSVDVEYATGFTRFVFWHRYIYQQEKKVVLKAWCVICLAYRMIMQIAFDSIRFCFGCKSKEEVLAFINGILEGKKWIDSEEYKQLNALK